MAVMAEKKCPCCGGAVVFDTDSQNLKCPYCDSEFDVDSLVLNNSNSDSSVVEQQEWNSENNEWAVGETDGMSVYGCNSCGGEIVADETTGATTCPYCGNPVVMKGQFEGTLRPNLIIPFRYDKKSAKAALKKHISEKKFVPKSFLSDNRLEEIRGIYVPYWLFTCDTYSDLNFKAEKINRWSDSDYDYTETSYFNVFRSGNLRFADIPVDGSVKMSDDLMESIEPFNINEAVDFNSSYLAGFLADKFDVASESCVPRVNERIRQSVDDSFRETVKGYDSVSTESVNMNSFNGICKYALCPVWILNTTWNGEKYTFAMNGQTGKFVGNIPTDKKAVTVTSVLSGTGIGAVIYGIMWLFDYAFPWWKIILALVIGLIIGFFVVGSVASKNKSVRYQENAVDYIVPGSMVVTSACDNFLYSNTERTPKPKPQNDQKNQR